MKDTLIQSKRLVHTRAFFSSPDAAPPRNLTNEMLQTLSGESQTAGPTLALNQQYEPLYGQLGLGNQQQSLYGWDDASGVHHPGTLEMNAGANTFTRASDLANVQQFGPASTQAYLAANPYLASGLNNLQGRMQNSPILNTLNDQANAALASGGQLSPQEQRALDQQTRQGFSDRGNVMGNQSLGAELLNRDAATRARLLAAQQFASGVQGLNQSQNDFVGRGTQIAATSLSDPYQAVLGRSGGAASSGSGGSYPQTIGTGAQLFSPTNAYAQDLFNTNFNAANANNIAQSNAQNAATGAIVSGVGSLLGGYLSNNQSKATTGATIAGSLLSDKRLKKNIRKTGEKTEDGVDLYEWEYVTDPKKRRYRGVMAQELEKADPESVITDEVSGLKLVKREAGTPFHEVVGKGKNKKYFSLTTGKFESFA
jgi:hypothetical protein